MLRVDLEDRVFANLLNDEEASWVRVVGKHWERETMRMMDWNTTVKEASICEGLRGSVVWQRQVPALPSQCFPQRAHISRK